MLRIEVVSSVVEERSGQKKDGSGTYNMRMQEAYLHDGHTYPARFTLVLGRMPDGQNQRPYPEGMYTLSPGSITVDGKTGRLAFAYSVMLEALPAEKPAVRAAS